jgi:hypothetical protein
MKFSQLGSLCVARGPWSGWGFSPEAYRWASRESVWETVYGANMDSDDANLFVLRLRLVTAMQELGPTYD